MPSKGPRPPRAKCEHSRRIAVIQPGLPESFQGLCRSCIGEAMLKHAQEQEAKRIAAKLTADIWHKAIAIRLCAFNTEFEQRNEFQEFVYDHTKQAVIDAGKQAVARYRRRRDLGSLL